VENFDLQQEEAPRHGNGRDRRKNMLDEGNFSLHGKSISGSQHVEGGGSAARCSLGGIGYDKLALQVATTRHGNTHPVDEPHGSGGEPHGSMSTNKAND